MNYKDIIDILDQRAHLISMSSLEGILEIGYNLGFNEQTRILDLCCGYGQMLKSWSEAYEVGGVGIDRDESFIRIGRERLVAAGVADKVELICGDIFDYGESGFDVVCLTENYLFGDMDACFKKLEAYIKPGGVIVIGTLIYSKDASQELIDFDGANLTEGEIYEVARANSYIPVSIARGTQAEWDRYITWTSRRSLENIKGCADEDARRGESEWMRKWFDMYANHRVPYENWATIAFKKF